jgi:hypothetical protein
MELYLMKLLECVPTIFIVQCFTFGIQQTKVQVYFFLFVHLAGPVMSDASCSLKAFFTVLIFVQLDDGARRSIYVYTTIVLYSFATF